MEVGTGQGELDLFRTWGGRRAGAGRKPAVGRRAVPHRRRAAHDRHCPAHVTLRAHTSVPSLRGDGLFPVIERALSSASRNGFRLLHYSVQSDHVHLLVEAEEPARFAHGVQGLAIRVAKAVNRVLRRAGRVWGDRYHARLLRTPREVRNALVYVLNNVRKHVRNVRGLDPRSSARWFDGWTVAVARSGRAAPVVSARTWLARVGWRRGGLIEPDETPSADRRRS